MLKQWVISVSALLLLPFGGVYAQNKDASAVDDEVAVFLVAAPRLVDPSYRQTVLLVIPTDNDRHIGFIINRPTQRSLSSLFPQHEPSKKVLDPVFFGGPMSRSALFAVVKTPTSPGTGSIKLMKDLFFTMRVDVVDKVIENSPNEARYYVGYVEWRPGELRQEINRGLWHVMNPDRSTIFRKNTDNLWEDLIRLSRAVSADAGAVIDPPKRAVN
jgi:putative transcriptional regulator